jgi:hypothetical protein
MTRRTRLWILVAIAVAVAGLASLPSAAPADTTGNLASSAGTKSFVGPADEPFFVD